MTNPFTLQVGSDTLQLHSHLVLASEHQGPMGVRSIFLELSTDWRDLRVFPRASWEVVQGSMWLCFLGVQWPLHLLAVVSSHPAGNKQPTKLTVGSLPRIKQVLDKTAPDHVLGQVFQNGEPHCLSVVMPRMHSREMQPKSQIRWDALTGSVDLLRQEVCFTGQVS